jgi:phage host-nuclease inhibitor protein Gam
MARLEDTVRALEALVQRQVKKIIELETKIKSLESSYNSKIKSILSKHESEIEALREDLAKAKKRSSSRSSRSKGVTKDEPTSE